MVKTIFNNIWIVSRLQKAMPGNKTGTKVLKVMGFQINGYKNPCCVQKTKQSWIEGDNSINIFKCSL